MGQSVVLGSQGGRGADTRDRVRTWLLHCKGQHACKWHVQANACPPVHAPQTPSSHLAPSPKHRDQAGQFGSKQTRHVASQGDPAHQQGLTNPSPLRSARILLSAIPIQPTTTATAQTQSPLHKDIPCQEVFVSPRVEQRRQIPAGRLTTSKDLQVQASRPEGHVHMHVLRAGTTPPHRAPHAEGRGPSPAPIPPRVWARAGRANTPNHITA